MTEKSAAKRSSSRATNRPKRYRDDPDSFLGPASEEDEQTWKPRQAKKSKVRGRAPLEEIGNSRGNQGAQATVGDDSGATGSEPTHHPTQAHPT
jgi:hypothetical protein